MNTWEGSSMWRCESASVLRLNFLPSLVIHTQEKANKTFCSTCKHIFTLKMQCYENIILIDIYHFISPFFFICSNTMMYVTTEKTKVDRSFRLTEKTPKAVNSTCRQWADRRTVSVAPRLHFSHSNVTVNNEHCPVFYVPQSWQCDNIRWSLHIATQN